MVLGGDGVNQGGDGVNQLYFSRFFKKKILSRCEKVIKNIQSSNMPNPKPMHFNLTL